MRMREPDGRVRFAQESLVDSEVGATTDGRTLMATSRSKCTSREIDDTHPATTSVAVNRVFAGKFGPERERFAGELSHGEY
jgi:hypothetical protein